MAFSDNELEIQNAFNTLYLTQDYKKYTKKDVITAFRGLVLKYHPDKGGAHAAFLELSQAYQIALKYFTERLSNQVQIENLAISQALAALYTTISRIENIFNKKTSKTISVKKLEKIFLILKVKLQRHVDRLLSNTPNYRFVRKLLIQTKIDLDNQIDNIYKGPTANQGALIAFSFMTIGLLAIFAPTIWVLWSTINYILLIELFSFALVGGFLFAAIIFFDAQYIHKQRSELQAEMRTISKAIENLVAAVSESIPNENNEPRQSCQLGMP